MDNEIKKRKVLLITPDYMDYTAVICSGISEYLDAETHLITTSGKELRFTYRNSFHRIQNFFSKLFLNKNQKKIFYSNAIKEKLETVFKEIGRASCRERV